MKKKGFDFSESSSKKNSKNGTENILKGLEDDPQNRVHLTQANNNLNQLVIGEENEMEIDVEDSNNSFESENEKDKGNGDEYESSSSGSDSERSSSSGSNEESKTNKDQAEE